MKTTLTLVALACATTFSANAEVRINGFANFIGGVTSSDDTAYGYDDRFSSSAESLFAIQVSGDINDKMSATGQIIARGENDYEADFEWAYLSYQATDNLTLSAGRFRLPLFSYSASLDVGYSYHWVNAPRTVYDVPFNNLDGIKLDYANYAGDWEYSLSASFGTYDSLLGTAEASGENTYLFSGEAVYDWFKVRAVFGGTKTTVDFSTADDPASQGLAAGLDAMAGAGFAELSNLLRIKDDSGQFFGLSAQVDKFDWFVSGEITSVEVEQSFAAKDVAYYLTAGIRKGAWTPSITYEHLGSDPDIKFQSQIAQIGASALPDEVKTQLTQLAVGAQLGQEEDFNVVTLSVRYDYDTNIALKADVSKISDDVDETNDATLVRFAVNYVF